MASFFGEVLPLSSRAVEDFEEDEDCLSHSECIVHWTEKTMTDVLSSPTKTLDCSTLIVATSPTATAFAESYLVEEDAECLAVISTEKEVDLKGNHRNHIATIHKLNRDPKVLACRTQKDVLPEQAHGIITQILAYIPKSAVCMVLTSQPAVEYRGDTSSPVLRALVTSKYSSTVPCPFIETPNILSGLSAQVMTHCQIEQRPAILFVLYMENIYFDSGYVNMFKQCLTSPPFSHLSLVDSTGSDDVQKKADMFAQSHNIYI